jgi:hypothetical protein
MGLNSLYLNGFLHYIGFSGVVTQCNSAPHPAIFEVQRGFQGLVSRVSSWNPEKVGESYPAPPPIQLIFPYIEGICFQEEGNMDYYQERRNEGLALAYATNASRARDMGEYARHILRLH